MTLFVVQARGSDVAALEKARFIRQGFSWGAFLFSWLWLAYHRCWLALLVWVILEVAFILLAVPHITPAAAILVDFLARLFLGLEGNNLRLSRNAVVDDIVEARDRDEAETIFFRRMLDERRA